MKIKRGISLNLSLAEKKRGLINNNINQQHETELFNLNYLYTEILRKKAVQQNIFYAVMK